MRAEDFVDERQLKDELTLLRLRGGQFRLPNRETLEISNDGQVVWTKEARSLEPKLPKDMSRHKYCRLEVDHDEYGREVFVVRASTVVAYVEDIRSLRKCKWHLT